MRKGRNERNEAGETKNDIIKRFAADKNVITIFNQFVGFPITFFFSSSTSHSSTSTYFHFISFLHVVDLGWFRNEES